jgi:aryl sulfotransferase
VVLPFKLGPPDAPELPGGMLNLCFSSFLNAWWPLRHKPNVLFLHFSAMKRDHEGSLRLVADFLGCQPTEEQWPRVLEYTSFPWMKCHEEKFETIFAGAPGQPKIKALQHGGMVRKGDAGHAAEDGMTPEIAAAIRGELEVLVTDPAALCWLYEGGVVTGGGPGVEG